MIGAFLGNFEERSPIFVKISQCDFAVPKPTPVKNDKEQINPFRSR